MDDLYAKAKDVYSSVVALQTRMDDFSDELGKVARALKNFSNKTNHRRRLTAEHLQTLLDYTPRENKVHSAEYELEDFLSENRSAIENFQKEFSQKQLAKKESYSAR